MEVMKLQLIWISLAFLYFNPVLPITALKSGPIGYILHRPSGKVILPYDSTSPVIDNREVVLHNSGLGQTFPQMQFVEVPGEDGFGYIRHVASGKYIHPLNGLQHPPNGQSLVFFQGAHKACLFKFDLQNDRIIQKTSGKIWHPYGGLADPPDSSVVNLNSDRHEHATFIFANEKGEKMAPTCPSKSGCPPCSI